MQSNYSVVIEDFAKKYFIKIFKKKYKNSWDITMRAIVAGFERIDNLLLTERAEIITHVGEIKIIKTKFRVANTKESAKTSGNRCIVSLHEGTGIVNILLVYNKNNIKAGNETAEWKRIIKENYPKYKELF